MTQPNDERRQELREQIDDITARLSPTGEFDADGKPIYQESRLPLSMLDSLIAYIDTYADQRVAEALDSIELPDHSEHNASCEGDRYCTCGTFGFNQALDQCKAAIQAQLTPTHKENE